MTICLDSNTVIYIANGTVDKAIASDHVLLCASVTRIESLGYDELPVGEAAAISAFLDTVIEVPLDDTVIQRAVTIRQQNKIKLGDSIIAATALEHDCELWTANTKDFAGIDDLKLRNPLPST